MAAIRGLRALILVVVFVVGAIWPSRSAVAALPTATLPPAIEGRDRVTVDNAPLAWRPRCNNFY